jgi:hypothetical protein
MDSDPGLLVFARSSGGCGASPRLKQHQAPRHVQAASGGVGTAGADLGRLVDHIRRAKASAPRLVTERGVLTVSDLSSATRGWTPMPIR